MQGYTLFVILNSMKETATEKDIKEMLESAVHFGHRKTRQNPKMKPYVFGIRNNVSIIDLEQSHAKLAVALEYIKNLPEEKKTILKKKTLLFRV